MRVEKEDAPQCYCCRAEGTIIFATTAFLIAGLAMITFAILSKTSLSPMVFGKNGITAALQLGVGGSAIGMAGIGGLFQKGMPCAN